MIRKTIAATFLTVFATGLGVGVAQAGDFNMGDASLDSTGSDSGRVIESDTPNDSPGVSQCPKKDSEAVGRFWTKNDEGEYEWRCHYAGIGDN